MAAELRIARDLSLPLDVLTEAVGIIATRGAGKTYGSVVLIEEAHDAGVPFVVIDPTGVYHGLRSSADGKRDGLPVYVIGGPHGDLPLEPASGAFLAGVVVDSGHSFVFDLSDLSKTKARSWVAAFLERLYERKARARNAVAVRPAYRTPPPSPKTGRIVPRSPRPLPRNHAGGDAPNLKAGARRMIVALARLHPEPLTKVQLGTLADITPTSGTFSDYKSALSRHGLITEDGGAIRLTDAGVELAGDHVGAGAPPPSELKAMWESKLKAGARRMLDVLYEAYPDGVSRDDLAERAEIKRGSGTFSDYLSALRRNNLAADRGGLVYCGDSLFLGGRR